MNFSLHKWSAYCFKSEKSPQTFFEIELALVPKWGWWDCLWTKVLALGPSCFVSFWLVWSKWFELLALWGRCSVARKTSNVACRSKCDENSLVHERTDMEAFASACRSSRFHKCYGGEWRRTEAAEIGFTQEVCVQGFPVGLRNHAIGDWEW